MAIATELFGRNVKKGEVIFHQGDPGEEMYIIQSGAVEVSKMRQGRKIVLTLLDKGEFFGEVALVDNKPRSATVTAITRTRLLPLSRHTFLQRITYNPDVVLVVLRALSRRIDRMTETIRSLIDGDEELRRKVFSSSSDFPDNFSSPDVSDIQMVEGPAEVLPPSVEHRRQVAANVLGTSLNMDDQNPISYPPDKIIFEHGDAGHNMFLITRGTVEIYQSGAYGENYRMALLGPGDCFGEMALISGEQRTASARAISAVELLMVNRESMLNGIRSDPEIGLFFLHVLISRLRTITDAAEQPEKSLQTLRQAVIPVINKSESVSVGISSLASCGGCVAAFVQNPQELRWIIENTEISYCPMLMDQENITQVNFAVVDGAVRSHEDEEKLIEVRRKSRYLIAMGTCAAFGGIPALANFYELEELISESFGRTTDPFLYYLAENGFGNETATPSVESHLQRKVRSLSDVVRVDYFLPGCPPVLGLLIDLLKELKGEQHPKTNRQIVCSECLRKYNKGPVDAVRVLPAADIGSDVCYLSHGILCLGFLTRGGCSAACPGGGLTCWGCRGPSNSVIAKLNRGETYEEVILNSLVRRLKVDESTIKLPIKVLRHKGGSALSFDQNFVKDASKIR